MVRYKTRHNFDCRLLAQDRLHASLSLPFDLAGDIGLFDFELVSRSSQNHMYSIRPNFRLGSNVYYTNVHTKVLHQVNYYTKYYTALVLLRAITWPLAYLILRTISIFTHWWSATIFFIACSGSGSHTLAKFSNWCPVNTTDAQVESGLLFENKPDYNRIHPIQSNTGQIKKDLL